MTDLDERGHLKHRASSIIYEHRQPAPGMFQSYRAALLYIVPLALSLGLAVWAWWRPMLLWTGYAALVWLTIHVLRALARKGERP